MRVRHHVAVPAATTFLQAWSEAATGSAGFWTTAAPTDHFRTASTLGPELAGALVRLLDQHPQIRRVVEVGAGDGRLLPQLRDAAGRSGRTLDVTGVDLRPRPAGLAADVGWVEDRWDVHRGAWVRGAVPELVGGGAGPALVLALEWLDDLPCRLARTVDGRWRELLADGRPGPALDAGSTRWAERWWPGGPVVEVGLTRDAAWSALVAALRVAGGLALAVDYGHLRAARPAGTVTAFAHGRRVEPVLRPDRDITAHVAVDALAAAGELAGARTLRLGRQRDLLAALEDDRTSDAADSGHRVADEAPRDHRGDGPGDGRGQDALGELAARSRRAALRSPTGWGHHWWLLQEVAPGPGRTAVAP